MCNMPGSAGGDENPMSCAAEECYTKSIHQTNDKTTSQREDTLISVETRDLQPRLGMIPVEMN